MSESASLMGITRPIIGESKVVKELISLIQRVSSARTNILISGESGTGKELVARMIHESGPLRSKPFVAVNCGAIPENLIESELFGHRKGSFTGAVVDKEGLFETANGGTLFLDEIGELPLSMQVKLLRVIQDRTIRKVGGVESIPVDVRIIAATNRDLENETKLGRFREDLYYRLNVILIQTPPLRDREGDIRILAETFLKKFSLKQGKPIQIFDPAVMSALEAYHWPGNIRELENVIERAVTLEMTSKIKINSLPENVVRLRVAPPEKGMPASAKTLAAAKEAVPDSSEIRLKAPDFSKGAIDLDEVLGEVEKIYLLKALEYTGGVKKKAADLLGMTFRSIRYRLKKLGVDEED